MMRPDKLAILATLVLITLGLGACGIKGPLQPPSAVSSAFDDTP